MAELVMIKSWLIQFVLYITILVFGLGMSWAAYGARVSELEKVAVVYNKDHDSLISLNTKMDLLLQRFTDMQIDMREHTNKK